MQCTVYIYNVTDLHSSLQLAAFVCIMCTQIPNVTLVSIPTARHPVKVGLSDAYYIDRPSDTGIDVHPVELTFCNRCWFLLLLIISLCRLLTHCLFCYHCSQILFVDLSASLFCAMFVYTFQHLHFSVHLIVISVFMLTYFIELL